MTALDYLTITMLVLTTVAVLTSLAVVAPVLWDSWKLRRKEAKASKNENALFLAQLERVKKQVQHAQPPQLRDAAGKPVKWRSLGFFRTTMTGSKGMRHFKTTRLDLARQAKASDHPTPKEVPTPKKRKRRS